MEHDFAWIYLLFFLAFPLARIIPRIIKRSRARAGQEQARDAPGQRFADVPEARPEEPGPQAPSAQPQTKEMLVLGEICRGARTFGKIKKSTGFGDSELDGVLERLEKKNLISVVERPGMLGTRIELRPTERGSKEYGAA